MAIRKAIANDLKDILPVYETARAVMKASGNPNQWGDTNPAVETLKADIEIGQLYVMEESGCILGCFALIPGPDPVYAVIEDGAWIGGMPYAGVHRVASSGKRKGILKDVLEWAETQADDLRIDTHRDNRIMQHLLEKYGFTYCGIVHVEDGTPRLAFEKRCGKKL